MNTDVFIATSNHQNCEALVADLLSTSAGVDMAAVIGQAGRGKTTSAERIVARNSRTVYVRYRETMSVVKLAKAIAFCLAGVKPSTTDAALTLIDEEMGRSPRLIIVDEIDRSSQRHINLLRDIHDICKSPILLVGEANLPRMIEKEGRIKSRVRRMLEYGPVSLIDVTVLYDESLGLTVDQVLAGRLLRHAGGDWRLIIKDALNLERLMKTNSLEAVNERVVDEICKVPH